MLRHGYSMQTSSAAPNPFNYRRHEPEKTLLYQVVAREWETWHAERQADTSRSPLPQYVAHEMDAYLRCGILDHGFLILSCEAAAGVGALAIFAIRTLTRGAQA